MFQMRFAYYPLQKRTGNFSCFASFLKLLIIKLESRISDATFVEEVNNEGSGVQETTAM